MYINMQMRPYVLIKAIESIVQMVTCKYIS